MSTFTSRWLSRADSAAVAVVDAGGAHAYAAVVAAAGRVAGTLLAGRASLAGERVAVLAAPGAGFVAAFYGVVLAGGCVVVLSPLHPPAETRYFCEDAGVRTVLVDAAHAAAAAALAPERTVRALEPILAAGAPAGALPALADAAPALQLYTSGTTGKPKGAVLTHANLAIQQQLLADAWGMRAGDTLLHVLPLHHMHGLCIALLNALGAGATTRFLPFDAVATWDALAGATTFMAVPAIYHRLFAAYDAADAATQARWGAAATRLRLATSGSAALPVPLAERWRALTGRIPLERFGMSELGVALTNPLDAERHLGCVGFPLPTVETRVVGDDGADAEVGELWVRGPSGFAGYHQRPAETAAAFAPGGWFKTGDTVTRVGGSDGPFKILGRTSVDILKSGGYKLSALEIEDVLRRHPAVDEVAVVGVPDPAWGDRVVACIVARGAAPSADDLRAFAKQHLAAYKVPKDVVFVTELPKNALGKVVKPTLVAQLTAS